MQADVHALHQLGQLTVLPKRIAELAEQLRQQSEQIQHTGTSLAQSTSGAAGSFGQAGPSLSTFLQSCGESFTAQAAGLAATSQTISEFATTVTSQDADAIATPGGMQ